MLNPLAFFQECENIGLKVPNYNQLSHHQLTEDLQQFKSLGLFENGHFYLNSKLKKIPIEGNFEKIEEFGFEEYMDHMDPDDPYVLTKVVEGDHYHANIICKNGSVMVLQVNPQITSVSNFTPPEIKKWSQQIVSAKSLSGMFTIEFVVAKQSQETTAIRMVPILQPSILAYGSDKEVSIFCLMKL